MKGEGLIRVSKGELIAAMYRVVLRILILAFGAGEALRVRIRFVSVGYHPIRFLSSGELEGAHRLTFLNNTGIVFLGIPYANGSRRFRAPVKPESWVGVRDATRYRASCPWNNTG